MFLYDEHMKNIELLTLEALAQALGKTANALRVNIHERVKTGRPLEYGVYKLVGGKSKQWYAYDSTKYNVKVVESFLKK